MHMWDNCAHMLSRHYAGTDSNTNMSGGGWASSWSVMITGVQRYFQKNFSDSLKNDVIKIILQKH
jgi:hypothetical protein